MTMMITRAPHSKVMSAIERTIDLEKLRFVMTSPEERRIDLRRDINIWTFGDDIKVHVVDIDPVVVVHIQSRVRRMAPQLGVW